MRKFRQFKRLRYIALIALIGAAFLLFRWTEQEKFSLAKMGEFQDEYVHAFFSEIDSREHPNCKKIREEYPLIEDQDGDMDIAFTLVVHKDVVQIIRLLRMIYRKNNYYCIHPDARSNVTFVNALQGAASCFGKNVELVPQERRIIVTWGYETVLKPHLICGEQALRRHSTWSYLINAVGQEFPLRTNLEIIAALKALNGSNLIESGSLESLKYRVRGTILPLKVTLTKFELELKRVYMNSFVNHIIKHQKLFINPYMVLILGTLGVRLSIKDFLKALEELMSKRLANP